MIKNIACKGLSLFSIPIVCLLLLLTTSQDCDPVPNLQPSPSPTIKADGTFLVGSAAYGPLPINPAKLQDDFPIKGTNTEKKTRQGLTSTFAYLKKGKLGFATYNNNSKDESKSHGGTIETIDLKTGNGTSTTILIGSFAPDSINITQEKLYHIIHDEQTKKFAIIPVEYWGIIGSATENEQESDQRLGFKYETRTASFTAEKIVLKPGKFKFRYNGWWAYDQIVADAQVTSITQDNLNSKITGFEKFESNFGGTLEKLMIGGNEINHTGERGEYTIEVSFNLVAPTTNYGISAKVTRTGNAVDAAIITGLSIYPTGGDATLAAVVDVSQTPWTVELPSIPTSVTISDVMVSNGATTNPALSELATVSNNQFQITASKNGLTSSTYTISITTSPPSNDATLASLTVENIQVDNLNHNTGTGSVSISLDKDEDQPTSVKIGVVTNDNMATIAPTGPTAMLENGSFKVTVTTQDGTTKTYTITVNFRSSDATLTSLTMSFQGLSTSATFQITLDEEEKTGTVELPILLALTGSLSTTIKATLGHDGATVSSPKNADSKSGVLQTIPISNRGSTFTVTVQAEDLTEVTYTITISLV